MKHVVLFFLLSCFFAGAVYSACPERQRSQPRQQVQRSEDAPDVCLDSFEMCNNWARHYCHAGNHERVVNNILRGMKERGMTVTTAIIKSVAHRTLRDARLPAKSTE